MGVANRDSSRKGTSTQCAGEVPTQGAGTAGTKADAATATIAVVSEAADTDGTDAAAVGGVDGAEWLGGRRDGETGNTFSDDANLHSGGCGVTSPSSGFILICMRLRSLFDRRVNLLQIVIILKCHSYRRCEGATCGMSLENNNNLSKSSWWPTDGRGCMSLVEPTTSERGFVCLKKEGASQKRMAAN